MQEKLQEKRTIKERIIYFVENQRIKKVDFFAKIGVTSANFRGSGINSSISSSTIERIITLYPQLNLYWLVTGKGQMIAKDVEAVPLTEPLIENESSNSELLELQRKMILMLEEKVERLEKKLSATGNQKAS